MQTIAERSGANQQVPPGQTIAAKGQVVRSLIILQKGQATVNSVETGPVGQPIMRPLYNINAPAVLAAAPLFSGARNNYQIVASAQSTCTVIPNTQEEIYRRLYHLVDTARGGGLLFWSRR